MRDIIKNKTNLIKQRWNGCTRFKFVMSDTLSRIDNGKEINFFNFYRQCWIGLFFSNWRELSVVVVVDIPRQVIRTFIYIGWARVARWITTVGPTDLATALKSGLIYYYVLLLLFGYLYLYNIMPREIPRSRRYVTVQLPRDRDLIFRIGHNLGRALSLRQILSIASTLSWPVKVSRAYLYVLYNK